MRKAAIFLVALMVVFAGCSSGGNGGNETDANSTATPDIDEEDGTPSDNDSDGSETTDGDSDVDPDDDSDSDSNGNSDDTYDTQPGADVNLSQAIESSSQNGFSGQTELDMTLINGSEEIHLLWQNDTERQLLTLDNSQQSGTTTYYITDSGSAVRNTTSGETRYGSGDGRIAAEAGFSLFIAFAGYAYIGVMDWEFARNTTVDGEKAFVFEADSINQSSFDDDDFELEASEVESATGEMVVTQRGIRSASVRITTPQGTAGVDLAITTGSDVTVEQPDWVDESQFGS